MLKVADCNVIWIKCRNVFCYVKYTLYLSYKTVLPEIGVNIVQCSLYVQHFITVPTKIIQGGINIFFLSDY